MNDEQLVRVRPIKISMWAEVTHYANCGEYLAPYFKHNGSIYTGNDKSDGVETKERNFLERETGLDLSPSSTYWETFAIRLTSKDLLLDPRDPFDKIKINFLKNHKDVQSSILDDSKPMARYILIDEVEEAEVKNKESRLRRRMLSELDKLTVTEMREALTLYGLNTGDMNESIVERALTDYIEENPGQFELLWVKNPHKKDQLLLRRAAHLGIVRIQNSRYYYGQTDMGLIETAINFISDEKNQDVKIAIIDQIKAKEKK